MSPTAAHRRPRATPVGRLWQARTHVSGDGVDRRRRPAWVSDGLRPCWPCLSQGNAGCSRHLIVGFPWRATIALPRLLPRTRRRIGVLLTDSSISAQGLTTGPAEARPDAVGTRTTVSPSALAAIRARFTPSILPTLPRAVKPVRRRARENEPRVSDRVRAAVRSRAGRRRATRCARLCGTRPADPCRPCCSR